MTRREKTLQVLKKLHDDLRDEEDGRTIDAEWMDDERDRQTLVRTIAKCAAIEVWQDISKPITISFISRMIS